MLLSRDNAAQARWDTFVAAHPEATFFHRADWRGLIEKAFGHPSHYLVVERQGQLCGVLPLTELRSTLFGHRLVSTGFCTGGGPLAVDDDALRALLEEAEQLGRDLGVDYVELRDFSEPVDGWIERNDLYAGFERAIGADEATSLKLIRRKQRAVLRKAMGAGFTTTIDSNVDDFFSLYARNMRDHGTPALPKRYFQLLMAAFGDSCEIQTVRRNGRAVSSVLSYYFGDRVMPYFTGSLPEARRSGSNDLMYWMVMRRAAERGYKTFDFGRSKVGTGPYRFKCNWGFKPRPITYKYRLLKLQSIPNVNPTNPHYALMIQVWQRLPIAVANFISPVLSRSLG
jgi:FemAB-related protein (PEP-CTERM system-associated)